MKKLLPLAVILLAFLIWRELPRTPPAAIAPEPEKRKSVALPSAPAPKVSVATSVPARPSPPPGRVIAPAPPSSEGGHPKPPPNAIPFRVIDGFVIAYGDQLLGKPTVENFPADGFIEAPKVAPWTGVEIAYSFAPNFRNPERVQRVIAYFNQYTPVKFVPWTNQKDSLVFSPGEIPLCLSYVGRIGGHQPIYLDDRCFEQEITHEIMHALGFIHEHSRPDRDQYVRVNWNKIEDDKRGQFEAAPASMAAPQTGRPFDYQSVMIYSPTDFAKVRGDEVLQSLSGNKIGPVENGLSPEDLARLVNMYSH